MKSRSEIEKEVKDDLAKSDMQLLVDVHEEILRDNRSMPENLIHAQKRLGSLSVRLARQTEKLNNRLLYLTLVLVILTALLFFVSFFDFPKIPILCTQRTNQGDKNR